MRSPLQLLLVLLPAAHLFCSCSADPGKLHRPQFLVTAPGIIRPGGNVTLGVELLEHSPPQVTVKAEVLKKANNLSVSVLEAEGVFEKGSFKTLTLPSIPLNSKDEIYELHVTGYAQDEILFSNFTRLTFETKRISVFIQTDKPLYKPKQEVKFRVLTLFPDFKPYKTPLNILIKDPKSNLIQQWLSVRSDLGVVSKTLQLSSHPILGDWSIQVQVNDQTYYQAFQVSEYVLPTFEVTLKTPLYFSLNSKDLHGTVTAKYTYGKPVKGDVTLRFSPLSFWGEKKNIKKSLKIDGSANFSFSDKEIKEVMDFLDGRFEYTHASPFGPIEILAIVTESLTGISRNASSNVFIKQHDYVIEFFDYYSALKPSLNFTANVKVFRSDDNPLTLEERKNDVVITVTQSNYSSYSNREHSSDEKTVVQTINYTVPPSGIFKIEIPVLPDSSELQLKASFLDSVNKMKVNGMFKSPSKTYIQLQTREEDIKVGSPFELVVIGNKPLKDLSYMVVSRGQLVAVGKQNSTTFSLMPENSWAPKACVIVYYVAEDGEIISDVLKISIELVFKNKVNLFWSKANAEPSEKVSLRISVTQPHSVVGIVAVDKSVNLMSMSNDITMENVIQELELYNTGYYLGMFMNSFAVFQECGLSVFTDAELVKDSFDGIYDTQDFPWRLDTEYDLELEEPNESSSVGNPRVRKHFPETWIWLDTDMGSRTLQEFEVTVPDSITSWVATAFVINDDLGLGLTTTPVELQAFQPFFIFLNLPYSVIRGEEFALEVTIFNYLKNAAEVKVTIEKSDQFEILMTSNEVNATKHEQIILVPSEDGKTAFFPVKPTQLGEIPITVTAISPVASDAITRRILVKAEGIEKSYSQSILLDLTDSRLQATTQTLSFSFPPNTVNGSERIQITAVGDILGSSINGLDSLIRMPYGCGEQNMINFAPNIYVLDYMTKRRQLSEKLKEKALSYMRQGYQRELLYQRDDGSFSAFGNDDKSGSTWLSAFVLRCFIEADPYIDIDENVLHRTYTWLKRHQKSNGEFWEPGRVINSKLQGGTKSPVTLTAYIVTSLLRYKKYQPNIDVQDSINFLESEFNRGISDSYTLALVTHTLSLVESLKAKEALDMLNWKATREGDVQFWASSVPKHPDSWQPSSQDIEVSAYALLSHFLQHQVSEGIPIMRWLSRQRNSLGGFVSTQDTVVALKALSEFAAQMNTERTNIQVNVSRPSSPKPVKFEIGTQNRFVLQTAELELAQPVEVDISANGFGIAICQLNVIYNVKESESSRRKRSIETQEAFDLDVAVHENKRDTNHLNLNVCTRFLEPDRSGMALMEVNLLSGFAVPPDAIPLSEIVKKVEHDHGKLNLYLDSVNETQFCVDIPAVRNFKVSNIQDASVSIVDYYEPRRQAVRSYNSEVQLSSCDLCGDAPGCLSCENRAFATFSPSLILLVLSSMLLLSSQHWL